MILPPELLKGFLYFTYDDHINYLSSKTKVIVAENRELKERIIQLKIDNQSLNEILSHESV